MPTDDLPTAEEQSDKNSFTPSRWRSPIFIVSVVVGAMASAVVINVITSDEPSMGSVDWVVTIAVATAGLSLILEAFARRLTVRADRATAQSRDAFDKAAAQALNSVGRTLPAPELSLEEELAEVLEALSATVKRLRQVSAKAETFETDVKELVARAEAAKATASLHENDAKRIAKLLGAETEARLQSEIRRLTIEHNRQIDGLRRSGSRTALWTFVGGVVLGTVGNVVVALVMG